MIFQITGYPRSGTAWLTTMFNLAPRIMAYHELALTDPNWKETINGIEKQGWAVADIGTYQYLPKAVIANSKKVFIHQDPKKSKERVSRINKEMGIDIFDIHKIWEQMSGNWISEWNPLIVEYEHLFKIETLKQIWDYCFGENEYACFPERKVKQLLKFNIQLHEPAKALSQPGSIERLAELL